MIHSAGILGPDGKTFCNALFRLLLLLLVLEASDPPYLSNDSVLSHATDKEITSSGKLPSCSTVRLQRHRNAKGYGKHVWRCFEQQHLKAFSQAVSLVDILVLL